MAIKGLDTFADVLAIVSDPKKYEAKLAEIRKEISIYTSVVESVAKINEVSFYVQNIEQKNKDAATVVDSARNQAKLMIEKAQEEVNVARKEAQVIRDKVKELNEKSQAVSKDVLTRELKLKEEEARTAKLSQVLVQKEKELQQLAEELEVRKQKLLAAIG